MVGGLEGWRQRLEERARHEGDVARAFGDDWRGWWEGSPCPPKAFGWKRMGA